MCLSKPKYSSKEQIDPTDNKVSPQSIHNEVIEPQISEQKGNQSKLVYAKPASCTKSQYANSLKLRLY